MSTAEQKNNGAFVWGELLDPELVVDLVSFLTQSRRTAVLTVVAEGRRKSVYFREGAIIAASSTRPEDRFGDIMFRRGMISREALDAALKKVGPGRKIGNVLMSEGHITAGDLWNVIKHQIEEILYSILLYETGQFTISSYDPAKVPTRTALQTHHALMEGLRRKDEMLHMRGSMPPLDAVLKRAAWTDQSVRLNPTERVVFDFCNGRKPLGQVLDEAGVGQFEATLAVHRLMAAGLVGVVEGQRDADADGIEKLVAAFNSAFVKVRSKLPDQTPGLDTFFANADGKVAMLFAGVRPDGSGQVALEALQANLATSPIENKARVLRRGLGEYLRFLLFVARESLPFDQVESLAVEARRLVGGY